jgi:hypothetical protein
MARHFRLQRHAVVGFTGMLFRLNGALLIISFIAFIDDQ